tara:strand:+ start:554 stop:664 length:111 start_codon:yes stop_codon:yes gene_type:complete
MLGHRGGYLLEKYFLNLGLAETCRMAEQPIKNNIIP